MLFVINEHSFFIFYIYNFLHLKDNSYTNNTNGTGRRGQAITEKILRFTTGASRQPLLGLSMNPTTLLDEVMFPSASTCINQLELPVEIVAYDFFYMSFLNDFFGLEQKSRMIYLLFFSTVLYQ
ncbi:hypothetical protein ACJMK2_018869 [Sinanodonta woodiana]|uniref:HECT domain-containing protein n=1 Tax=Sinanodonta woodiana TaxID=1069815 RepID=A0ABD3UEU4_SINWO